MKLLIALIGIAAATERAFASPEGKRWLAHAAPFIG